MRDSIKNKTIKVRKLLEEQIKRLMELFQRDNRKISAESIRDPPEIYDLVRAQLPLKGKLALDIGANVGQYIALLASRFERVIAFEPSLMAFFELAKKARAYPNLEVYNVALSDNTGIVYLCKYEKVWEEKYFDLSVLDEKRGFSCWGRKIGMVPVLALRLDDLMLSDVDFIKVDAEGAEATIVRGGVETIKRCKPFLFVEIHEEAQGKQIVSTLGDIYSFKEIRHPKYRPHTSLWRRHYFLFTSSKKV